MKYLLTVILLLSFNSSQAAYVDGNSLLSKCEGGNESYCIGYLAGINDGYLAAFNWGDIKEKSFCVPDGATQGQLQRVAINGLKANPQNLHLVASSLVMNIFVAAFPCE